MSTEAVADGAPPALPYAKLRVVEFTHMVMGPTCGMVLADLGADVVKVEPVGGDGTRRLAGSGAGFFASFNRNKRSLALDVHDARGAEVMRRLVARADVFSENFKDGTMAGLGLDHETLSAANPRLVHVSMKGFLPGPYEHRTALDEVVQMMGGLAYMTGPEGRPLRAGSSVNDIMGGLFGAIGAMAALAERERTGRGQAVRSALFENNVFLVAQHMMQFALTGVAAAPMPSRISAWAVYDVFTVLGGEQIFLAVVSDTQWALFCSAFGLTALQGDLRLLRNNDRVGARDWLVPHLRAHFAALSADAIAAVFERIGLPFARIAKPHELFDDPHLLATGGLAAMSVPADASAAARAVDTHAALLPITMGGRRLPLRGGPPSLGEGGRAVMRELGYSDGDMRDLVAARVLVLPEAPADGSVGGR